MSAPIIDELFSRAVAGSYEDESAWEAVHSLRRIGTREVFEKARDLCKSQDPLARARGADVLAQLGKTADHPSNSFPQESYKVVTNLLECELDSLPLAAAIAALGHLNNPAAVPLIARFAVHPSSDVRFDVAFALGCFPDDPLSCTTLVQLTRDEDKDVRDWSTFGLGVQGKTDSVEIREALFQRLGDSSEDVREEAMVGLGQRHDKRVLPCLLAALDAPKTPERTIEAACLMLEVETEPEGWTGSDYAKALRGRFTFYGL